jgi:hypothetical protein
MRRRTLRLAAAALFAGCVLANPWLAAKPTLHMLVQLPLLAIAGAFVVPGDFQASARWNAGGFASLIIAALGATFWMIPRSIDAAVNDPAMTVIKFIALPVLGVFFAIGWRRAHALLKGAIKSQVISSAVIMAFLYGEAPARLCNNYLIDDQRQLATAFLWLACALAIVWVIPLFRAPKMPTAGCQGESRDSLKRKFHRNQVRVRRRHMLTLIS